MTAIWQNDGTGWRLLAPTGFPIEQTLHDLVEETPQILPLAGDPRLVVVGKEVSLGNGYADLLAVEPSGRLAIVEIKLARNAEARRAVVAQVLTYAAHLKGLRPEAVERDVLGYHLRDRGHESLQDAVAAEDQEGSFDPQAFSEGLAECLSSGHFRLVLVLDEAPEELAALVGYLESVTDGLLIDLVAVSAYEVGGSQVVIPQRVDAERQDAGGGVQPPSPPKPKGHLVEGGADFAAVIEESPQEHRPQLRRLYEWAVGLEKEGLVRLNTYHGIAHRWTLLPRLPAEKAGLVTIWNEGGAYLQFWRSVFERRAPNSLARVEQVTPVRIGQGNTTREVSDELLEALTDAYREAASGKIKGNSK
jgi:hypothetical protein